MDTPSVATAIASVLVALVSAWSARASQKSAKKAAVQNTTFSVQAKALEKAYERAREFDTETIRRQNLEIGRISGLYDKANEHIEELEGIVTSLRMQVAKLVAEKTAEKHGRRKSED